MKWTTEESMTANLQIKNENPFFDWFDILIFCSVCCRGRWRLSNCCCNDVMWRMCVHVCAHALKRVKSGLKNVRNRTRLNMKSSEERNASFQHDIWCYSTVYWTLSLIDTVQNWLIDCKNKARRPTRAGQPTDDLNDHKFTSEGQPPDSKEALGNLETGGSLISKHATRINFSFHLGWNQAFGFAVWCIRSGRAHLFWLYCIGCAPVVNLCIVSVTTMNRSNWYHDILRQVFENELQTFKRANKRPLNHNYVFYNKLSPLPSLRLREVEDMMGCFCKWVWGVSAGHGRGR